MKNFVMREDAVESGMSVFIGEMAENKNNNSIVGEQGCGKKSKSKKKDEEDDEENEDGMEMSKKGKSKKTKCSKCGSEMKSGKCSECSKKAGAGEQGCGKSKKGEMEDNNSSKTPTIKGKDWYNKQKQKGMKDAKNKPSVCSKCGKGSMKNGVCDKCGFGAKDTSGEQGCGKSKKK